MKRTTNYFTLPPVELQQVDGYGYTKEERKILDSAPEARFFDSFRDLSESLAWYKSHFEIVEILKMLDGRFCLLLDCLIY